MPVVRINKIVRKILSSICLLMIFIVFILYISVSEDVPTNNNNFNKENNETKWTHNNTEISSKTTTQDILIFSILLCLLVVIIIILWRIYYMPLYNFLCNRLFRRNQINEPEPAVHFQQNGIPAFLQDIRDNNEENVQQEQLLHNRNHPEDA